ncbi:MAG: carbohydrate-binding domain-containing protein [Verrucomicrobiota bacterium]
MSKNSITPLASRFAEAAAAQRTHFNRKPTPENSAAGSGPAWRVRKSLLPGFLRAAALGLMVVASAGAAADADRVENSTWPSQVIIAFNGSSATVSNGASSGVTYVQTGAALVITSTVAGVEYVLSGTSAAGYVSITGTNACKLTLNGVHLDCTNGPAISILSTNRCYVVLAEGTTNSLSDSTTYTQSGSGTFYATGALVISGRGSLSVTGLKGHGISTKTYLRMLGGDVTVPAAAKDGIHTVSSFIMDQGTLNIAAASDGIDGDVGTVVINGGSINIYSTTDDVKGIKCDGTMTVTGGAINMTVNGVQSKALKSTGEMVINGGSLIFNLSGGVYLGTAASYTTNGSTVTTNTYTDPSYSTAIKCDTNLTITGGSITVTHTGTAGKGISADGNILITGGTFNLFTSGGASSIYTNDLKAADIAAADCLKADGTLQILGGKIYALSTGNAGDCISADGAAVIGVLGVTNSPVFNLATRGSKVLVSGSGESADYSNPKTFSVGGDLTFNGGVFTASTKNDGGEGLESKARLTINGGILEITAYDDCINASSNITINAGTIYCYSSGNDAIDSNGTMNINGGLIIASGTTAPEEGFDCDQNTFSITGGIMVGTGGATSTPTAANCTQRSVLYTTNGTAGTIIQVKSSAGSNLVYKIPRTYSSGGGGGPGGSSAGMVLLFSNPSLANTTYTIVSGVTVTGATEFHGYYTGGTVTGGTTNKTFTISSMVTTVK